ncbi:ATP-binding cassette domain-containing protein, partial [Candidatus Poribacteria bacterium]|nr:ATP-binding cassette domain-containing protein [Candidatus Poribacteria bacterium]
MNEILKVECVSLHFGGIHALSDVSLGVNKGEIFSIIGPNGAGKTSLLNSISGFYHPQKGSIHFESRDITISAPRKPPFSNVGRNWREPFLRLNFNVFCGIIPRVS